MRQSCTAVAIASAAIAKQETVSTVKGYLVGKTIEASSFL
jgi:hypothetical protein